MEYQRERLALFTINTTGEITGAAIKGRFLDAQQAQQLWARYQWRPASVGQPWPAVAHPPVVDQAAAAPEW